MSELLDQIGRIPGAWVIATFFWLAAARCFGHAYVHCLGAHEQEVPRGR